MATRSQLCWAVWPMVSGRYVTDLVPLTQSLHDARSADGADEGIDDCLLAGP